MIDNTLEEEIENATKKVQEREGLIDSELNELKSKINEYTNYAWNSVWIGVSIAAISAVIYCVKAPNDEFGLNLLGDFMAGTVASVWSLAGLFFIYVAFLGQKQQLLNQQLEILYSQLELKYTRLELSGQRKEMEEQNKTLRLQQFESTFFRLFNLFNSVIDSLVIRNIASSNIMYSGKDCFNLFCIQFINVLESKNNVSRLKLHKLTLEKVMITYNDIYETNKSYLGHYFRTFFHVIMFVDQSDIENKKQYISILRAQLSSNEQVLLFYNCLHENGKEKFKPLIEKYALFKNIDRSLIFNEEHFNEYDASAYGK